MWRCTTNVEIRSTDWSLVFVDDAAAVFMRKKSDAAALEIEIDDPVLLASEHNEHVVSDADSVRPQVLFFVSSGPLGRPGRAREFAVRRYPEFRE